MARPDAIALAFAAVAAAAGGVALVVARRRGAAEAPLSGTGPIRLDGLVQRRELARGVHPDLQALLDAWEREGWFPVTIGSGTFGGIAYNGGLRTSAVAQAKTAGAGLSKASTLASTPHGRGAALDVWPVGFDPARPFSAQPQMQQLMQAFGEFAERRGLVWGGRWKNFMSPGAEVAGDWPHVEVPHWASLPFPSNYA